MHLRGVALLLLLHPGGAHRSIRVDGSHHDAQQQDSTLANDFEVSAAAREAWQGGFVPRAGPQAGRRAGHLVAKEDEYLAAPALLKKQFDGGLRAFDTYQKSQKEGMSFKQSVADALAGEYDNVATTAEVKSLAASAPLVLFTWEASPACKRAIKLLAEAGVKAKIIRLDDPWSEGNPRRAALGRLTGQSSVPSVWIGGEYVGGCDDGPDPIDAPGLVPLAFRGKLYEKLAAAGALEAGKAA